MVKGPQGGVSDAVHHLINGIVKKYIVKLIQLGGKKGVSKTIGKGGKERAGEPVGKKT